MILKSQRTGMSELCCVYCVGFLVGGYRTSTQGTLGESATYQCRLERF